MNESKQKIIRIGKALLALNLQNTHSGNISLKTGKKIYITRSGSMKGHLKEKDIIVFNFADPVENVHQASSEILTHKGILQYGDAVIHTHSLTSTLLAFIENQIRPIDYLGKLYLKSVPVKTFRKPVGSREMADHIPNVLSDHVAMVVRSHGPFVRGRNLHEAMMFTCILEFSAKILFHLKLMGADISALGSSFSPPADYLKRPVCSEIVMDRLTTDRCMKISADLFQMQLSPFHTGSLSIKINRRMIYIPNASVPAGFRLGFYRLDEPDNNDNFFRKLHQSVYKYSSARAAIFFHSPFSLIQSISCLNRRGKGIIPVDAEGRHLYPFIPVVPADENQKKIISLAEKNKMVVFPGCGALSIGESLEDTIHHCSSLKNICTLMTGIELMKKKNWSNIKK